VIDKLHVTVNQGTSLKRLSRNEIYRQVSSRIFIEIA